jgi:hypothetical protein
LAGQEQQEGELAGGELERLAGEDDAALQAVDLEGADCMRPKPWVRRSTAWMRASSSSISNGLTR